MDTKINFKMIKGVKRYYQVLPNGRWKFVPAPKKA